MKTKKIISVLLSFCLVLSSLLSCGILVEAKTTYSIYSDSVVNAKAGEIVSVPVNISGNQGIMGLDFYISYDSSVLTPYLSPSSDYSAIAGDVLTDGLLTDDVGGSEFVEGSIRVCWNHSSQIVTDGTLFTLRFTVNSKAIGSTVLRFNNTKSEAYNGNFDDVALNFEEINVSIQNNEYDGNPIFSFQTNDSISAGEQLNVDLLAENIGQMDSVKLTVPYNADNFKFSRMTVNGVVATATDTESGVIITISSFVNKTDGKKLTLQFQSESYATSRKYTFTADYSDLSGVDRILVKGAEIIIKPTASSDSIVVYSDNEIKTTVGEQQLIVPLYIKHNTGLMGYTLKFNYDPSILEAVSVNGSGPFSSNLFTNIEKKLPGEFTCMWFGNEDIYTNGDFITLTFNVLSTEESIGKITISYNETDIISENVDGVGISIPDINYTVNKPAFQIGDTNLDGIINIRDVTAIQRHIAEIELFTEEQLSLADTNGDGVVDINDATHLQKYLAEFDGIVLGKQN